MTEDKFIVGLGIFVILIKAILFCFAIWKLIHYSWLDAIALILIAEFLSWIAQYLVEEWEKISKS